MFLYFKVPPGKKVQWSTRKKFSLWLIVKEKVIRRGAFSLIVYQKDGGIKMWTSLEGLCLQSSRTAISPERGQGEPN